MTHDEALDQLAAAGHLHAGRFRELCADDTDPERRDGYRAVVVRLARGEPLAPTPGVSYGESSPVLRPCCGGSAPQV